MTSASPDVTPLATPGRALTIGAHPDDAEIGAGGTLARWAEAGCAITMVVVTDGSKGSWDRSVSPAEVAAIRRSEQAEAAKELGSARVVHLGHPDGELENTMPLRQQLCAQIRMHKPDVLLSHDPWLRYELHPDHRATGQAALDAMVAARDHLYFPEQGLEPHRPALMLLWWPQEADHWEDIGGSLESKIATLMHHESQQATSFGAGDGRPERLRRFISDLAEEAGRAPGMDHAEAFKLITP